ncbi:MAG: hypothetical protein LiPW39_391 [Parcubacteria group bacterium LiPW_39]|nr:MAG: hypothetical protein LiPW39_391 [Parcubacteria group bacterium LiPW_39]
MEDENRGKEPDKEDGFDLKVKDLTHCSSLSSVNQAGFRWQEIVIKRKPAFFYFRQSLLEHLVLLLFVSTSNEPH